MDKFQLKYDCDLYPQKGNLVYKYRPFRNYRLDKDYYIINNKYYSQADIDTGILHKVKIKEEEAGREFYKEGEISDLLKQELLKQPKSNDRYYVVRKSEESITISYLDNEGKNREITIEPKQIGDDNLCIYELPGNIMYQYGRKRYKPDIRLLYPDLSEAEFKQAGELTDFITEEFNFDLQHPVDIVSQQSYDGSVNLILNDGKNTPKLINSRFSPLGKNTYQVVDRTGTNDTNIYDRGIQFEIDTSLYKTYNDIPQLQFLGMDQSGRLSVGNYHFYFKYVDDDNNETDIIQESKLVQVFIGEQNSINSGFRNQDSGKSVKFLLTNIDTCYKYLNVYYTVYTSDINQNYTVQAYKINTKYAINDYGTCIILVNGYESKTEISVDELNIRYYLCQYANTQAICQNRLFLGNIQDTPVFSNELRDLSLRIYPQINVEKSYTGTNYNYTTSDSNTYRDPLFTYNYTGYMNHEIYRFGIVYIYYNNSCSVVYNILGSNVEITELGESFDIRDSNNNRKYLNIIEEEYKIEDNANYNPSGVYKINHDKIENEYITGINFKIHDKETLMSELSKQGIKGFFFVRQKRIPIRLCQGYTIGIEDNTHTPVIPINDTTYQTEGFLTSDRYLTNEFDRRVKDVESKYVSNYGVICPEYDINSPYYNSLFCGNKYYIQQASEPVYASTSGRLFYIQPKIKVNNYLYTYANILGVEDNVKLVAIKEILFSARAGEAEEAFKFECIGKDIDNREEHNLLRGSYGPYLGILGYNKPATIINICTNEVKQTIQEQFKTRCIDQSPFYPISHRYRVSDMKDTMTEYGGDCFICTFTHRINRNFQSPSAPTNDLIVEPLTWKDNVQVNDGVLVKTSLEKINLGDINAVKLGTWLTVQVISSVNLNIRALDSSNTDERSLFGHERGFYPYFDLLADGSYKIPEALCYNDGFKVYSSQRVYQNFITPPAIKNDFTNRIIYSDIESTDLFKNGLRTFNNTNYRDYSKSFGQIIKLIEFHNNLICVFEHAVCLIPVNERVVAGEGDGGNAFINTKTVLPENPLVISNIYGSQWKDSVVRTDLGIYGVDTSAKKIWFTDGEDLTCISEFKIQQFLNNNISLKERELQPIIGIRNVKTHYNKYKGDIMFTFYDNLNGCQEKVWNICYNEQLHTFITFYSWIPSMSENIQNQFYSFDRETSKIIAKIDLTTNSDYEDQKIYLTQNIIDEDSNKHTYNKVDYIKIGVLFTKYNNSKYKLINNSQKYFYIDDNVLYIKAEYSNYNYKEVYIKADISENDITIDTFESTLYVVNKNYLDKLTTSIWKHGKSGIIDNSEDPKPTNWYGKQHPFELEFIVNDQPQYHKIFDNLEILSNYSEPESFHYEIIGDCYDFAKDKQNMFIRQEATKELYQYNGTDISFDPNYINLSENHRKLKDNNNVYDKSTLLPLYYSRQDSLNTIEDYYHLKDGSNTKDFSALSGGEIIYYKDRNEFRFCNHAKAVDLSNGRLRGNMQYQEDIWHIQINPMNIVQKNESDWLDLNKNKTDKIPVEINQNPIPKEVLDLGNIKVPSDFINRGYTQWNWKDTDRKEVKIKDKWIKIRIRYSGKKLTLIQLINTLYNISFA